MYNPPKYRRVVFNLPHVAFFQEHIFIIAQKIQSSNLTSRITIGKTASLASPGSTAVPLESNSPKVTAVTSERGEAFRLFVGQSHGSLKKRGLGTLVKSHVFLFQETASNTATLRKILIVYDCQCQQLGNKMWQF